MDSDIDKCFKSKIITVFGTKYIIKHKNNNILNNKFSIIIGLTFHIIYNFFTNAVLFRKILIIIGFISMIFIILCQKIESMIDECISMDILCPYVNLSCNDLSYNDTYNCILSTNYNDLIYHSIIYLISLIYNLVKIIILLYAFTLSCEIFMMSINNTIYRYKEQIPIIENII